MNKSVVIVEETGFASAACRASRTASDIKCVGAFATGEEA